MKNTYSALLMLFVISCSGPGEKMAKAKIFSKSGSGVIGEVAFKEVKGAIKIEANIVGVGAGPVAIHIHTLGDCSSDDGKSSGGHWNPTGEDHGKWGETMFHSGDIGNLEVDGFGAGKVVFTDRYGRWSIGGPRETDIIGKAIVIHVGMDDMVSQPSGAAGRRIGCGVITKAR